MSMRKKLLTVLFCCLMVMLFTDLVGQTKMPKLIGLDIKEAKQLINKNGLTLKGVREIQSRAPAGTVIRQRPIPQRAVPEGGGVILVVSLGPTGKMPQPPKDEIKQPVPDVEQDVEGEKDEEPLLKPRRVPKKPARTIVSESVNADTLIFKLTEGTGLRLRQGKLALVEDRLDEIRFKRFNLTRQLIRTQMDSLNRIFSGRQIRLVNRLFSASEQDLDRDRTDAERRSGNELADLNLYLMIVLRQGQNLARMCDRLNQLPVVEIAYPKPEFSLPQCRDVAPATPSYVASQDYLGPAPDGIDAYYAWLFPGGEGENIQVMDIEYGWTLTHEDLPGVFYINAPVMRYEDHGTAVLSILAGCSNSYGITGIVHQADIGIFSCWTISIADAINSATQILDPGDIILLEQQTADSINGINLVPVEYHQAEYDAIKAATAGGYVVVEAAGNGDENLDRRAFNDIFDRDFRDSGAIMIGAADAYTHVPSNFTTYGDRVDVHAWGQRIWCAGYGVVRVNGLDHNQWYTNDFSGTSGASAITAGAVASIQSFLLQQGRQILSSEEMRNLLRNTGTPQAADAKQIGPMADLRRAFESLNQCCMAAGKFNDDAYIDLAIGIPYANIGTNICTGVVVVLKGTASGLDVSNPVVFHQDTENIPGGAESYDRFGAALAAGDFDGNGLDDLAIGSPGENLSGKDDAGYVTIIYSTPNRGLNPDYRVQGFSQNSSGIPGGDEDGDHFGAALAAGRFNGDNKADLAIGVPNEEVSGIVKAGAVVTIYGTADGLNPNSFAQHFYQALSVIRGTANKDEFFGAALCAADFDGNGKDDLAVGIPGDVAENGYAAGAVQIIYSDESGLHPNWHCERIDQETPYVYGSSRAWDGFGRILAAGDFDRNGCKDLVIGGPGKIAQGNRDAGGVWIVAGTRSWGLHAQEWAQFFDQSSTDFPGSPEPYDVMPSALVVGDFDQNGRDDLAIGCSGEGISIKDDAGAVIIIYNGSNQLDPEYRQQLIDQSTSGVPGDPEVCDHFGFALAAGKFNGQKYELAVAVPSEYIGSDLAYGYSIFLPSTATGINTQAAYNFDGYEQ